MRSCIAAIPFEDSVMFLNYDKGEGPYIRRVDTPLNLPLVTSSIVMQTTPCLRWLILIKGRGILEVVIPPGEVDIFAGMTATEIVAEIMSVIRKEAPKIGNYTFTMHQAPCFFEGGPVFTLEEILLRNEIKKMRA